MIHLLGCSHSFTAGLGVQYVCFPACCRLLSEQTAAPQLLTTSFGLCVLLLQRRPGACAAQETGLAAGLPGTRGLGGARLCFSRSLPSLLAAAL